MILLSVMRSSLEHISVSDLIKNTSSNYDLAFRRDEILPPDEVSIGMGISAGHSIHYQRLAERLYGYETDPLRPARVLDLGTGSGAFLVGLIMSGNQHPTEVVGLDNDPNALHYARYNVKRAMLQHPGIYESKFLNEDWNNPEFWREAGMFDVIFMNPPYLSPGVAVRPGYETTPPAHIYSYDNLQVYQNLFTKCMDHIVLGGRLIYRTPGKSAESIGFQPDIKSRDEIASRVGSLTLITQMFGYYDRVACYSDFSPLPERQVLPAWADPRVLVYAQDGIDINT